MENIKKKPQKSKNTKANSESKPPIKPKTVPPVRQTLTSYKRMLKANPLLKYQEAGVDVDKLMGFKSEGTSLKESTSSTLENKISGKEFKKPEPQPFRRTQSLKIPKSNGLDLRGRKPSIISGNLPLTNNHFKRPTISMSLNNNSNTNTTKSKSENTSKYASSKEKYKKPVQSKEKSNLLPKHYISLKSKSEININKATLTTENIKNLNKLRRSFSSEDIKNKSDIVKRNTGSTMVASKPANLQYVEKNCYTLANFPREISPITEESSENKNFIFKSPSAYERRSICSFTPHSVQKSSLFEASTPASVETQYLQERLTKWLKSRGRPIGSFRNLRCFGKKNQAKKSLVIDEENKENIEIAEERLECLENTNIVTTPESSKVDLQIQNDTPEEELPKVAKNAMVELQQLIEEDYPRAQCLGWLELIGEKYKKVVDEPEYWECRAAIEQSAGNVGNAVEFYKTAIIQGAEVSTVDRSLDQLLKKFSLLIISPNKSNQKKVDENKERIVREARTVFKSTIIQCAVQERKLKK